MRDETTTASGATSDELRIERLTTALGDTTRRRVFFAVREAGGTVSKDEVAAAVGIERRLAAHHLDKLVDYGFLTAEFHRRSGRSGPGAGRPAKHYRLAEEEQEVAALPERHYDLLASLLLKAASDTSEGSRQDVLEQIGHDFGYQVGLAEVAAGRTRPGQVGVDAATQVVRLLSRYGFAPQAEAEGEGTTIRACACPFEELAFNDPERICGLDRSIWKGMLAAFDSHATLSVAASRAKGDEACVAEIVPTD
ncbi:MAG: transcriptional regulator [Thermoleophilia bacterium]